MAAAGLFWGCTEDEPDVAKAVLASTTEITFSGQNASPQIITVYSDATWTADVPDWVTISPMTGSGTVDVTVSVADNLRDGSLDNPRDAELVFHGNTIASRSVVTVNQEGDKFRDVAEVTVSDVASMAEDAVVVIKTSQVVGLASEGFLISDGSQTVYVQSDAQAVIGDNAEIWGSKTTRTGLPAIDEINKAELTNNSPVNYPSPVDITSVIDSWTSTSRDYIMVTGTLMGTSLTVEGAETMRVNITDAHESVDLESLNNHEVVLYGYFAGVQSPVVNVIPVKFDDLGAVSGVIFADDFSWMAPYIAYYNERNSTPIGKSVEDNNASGNAPNVYTTDDLADLLIALADKGYDDINASKTSLYPQDCYWKFGKTNNHTGFRLPSFNCAGDVVLTFDWSPHMTGSGNIDKVNIVVEVEGEGKVVTSAGPASVSDPFDNDWTKGQLGWKTVSCTIQGMATTDRVIIRPEYLENHDGVTQMRWYLDNIVVSRPGGETPTGTLFEDDFSWMTSLITQYAADGTAIGQSVEDNDPSGDAPNAYSKTPLLIQQFYAEGYVDLHPEWKVMYPQNAYWKMGKTCSGSADTNGEYNVTGIILPDFMTSSEPADIVVSFNWCCHRRVKSGVDETDPVQVVVETVQNIDYTTDLNDLRATKYESVAVSDPLTTEQVLGTMSWQYAEVAVKGFTNGQRIAIHPLNMTPANSTVNRWYIDNIKVTVQE